MIRAFLYVSQKSIILKNYVILSCTQKFKDLKNINPMQVQQINAFLQNIRDLLFIGAKVWDDQ